VLRFEIKSIDPGRTTVNAVPEIERLSSELQAAVDGEFPGARLRIRRAEGIPVLRELQELILQIDWHAVTTGAETALGSFVATEFLKLVKSKIRNVFAKQIQNRTATSDPSDSPGPRNGQLSPKPDGKPGGRGRNPKTSEDTRTKSRSARGRRKT